MGDSLDALAARLRGLRPWDFDPGNSDGDGAQRLYAVCDELKARDDPERWAPLLYAFMERLGDTEIGSPGPVVHALESWAGYRPLLADSLRRLPTPLSVWMANRVLNGDPPDADEWLALMRVVAEHPSATPLTRDEARDFLEYQAGRR